MPKKTIKKYLPSPKKIKQMRILSLFGTMLHDGNLWHLNRPLGAWCLCGGLVLELDAVTLSDGIFGAGGGAIASELTAVGGAGLDFEPANDAGNVLPVLPDWYRRTKNSGRAFCL